MDWCCSGVRQFLHSSTSLQQQPGTGGISGLIIIHWNRKTWTGTCQLVPAQVQSVTPVSTRCDQVSAIWQVPPLTASLPRLCYPNPPVSVIIALSGRDFLCSTHL